MGRVEGPLHTWCAGIVSASHSSAATKQVARRNLGDQKGNVRQSGIALAPDLLEQVACVCHGQKDPREVSADPLVDLDSGLTEKDLQAG